MNIITKDHKLASGRDNLTVLLRNKHVNEHAPAILFVHGATYPSTVTFDYAIDGRSWMDTLALAGFDVWCIDLLGYGGADRPPAMAVPADQHPPIVDTEEAVADVLRAIDFILARRQVPTLDLIGYSWGTAICGQVAGTVPGNIRRLVLAGALWVQAGSVQITVEGALGAYRMVDAAATVKRWTVGLDASQRAAIAPAERLQQWAHAAVASDPQSSRQQPARLRAPTGVVKDVMTYWLRDTPTYDPALIRAPTLVVMGEWDQETTPAQGLQVFARLTGTNTRRLVILGAATHLMLLEEQRQQLYAVVNDFLSTP